MFECTAARTVFSIGLLLVLQEFNELEYYSQIPGSNPAAYRYNFWGYSTVGFFAPMSRCDIAH